MLAAMTGETGSGHRVIVLTGATSGIGEQTARRLARREGRLIVQGPQQRASVTGLIAELNAGRDEPVVYVECDFADLAAVPVAAHRIREVAGGPIHALINDAAIAGPERRVTTADGHERALQVNFLAPVLLTESLRSSMPREARIVNVASATHEGADLTVDNIELERGYSSIGSYARTKLALVIYTLWWTRHRPDDATAVSLHPGVIDTGLLRSMFGSIGTSADRGASSILQALDAGAVGGEYFDESRLSTPSPRARDAALGDELMAWTFAQLAAL